LKVGPDYGEVSVHGPWDDVVRCLAESGAAKKLQLAGGFLFDDPLSELAPLIRRVEVYRFELMSLQDNVDESA
jgi:hypothetical protein